MPSADAARVACPGCGAVLRDIDGPVHSYMLTPPAGFQITAADVALHSGTPAHAREVRAWAVATWSDWRAHHRYIREFSAACA